MIKEEMLDRIKAVMIGHAVGDALGVPVEFKDREILQKDPVTDMRGFGTYPVPAGSWSDDTSMSLCALEALSHKDWSWDMIMNNFVSWLENGEFTPTGEAFDVGRTCLEAIVRYKRDGLPPMECGCDGEYSNGNGSLMRIHPFVLYAINIEEDDLYWRLMEIAKNASRLTHAHQISVVACQIYGVCLTYLLLNESKDIIYDALEFAAEEFVTPSELMHYKRIFKPDFADLPENEIKSSGYVVDTLEAALWCLLTTDNYKDCVLKAVNLGKDADTVAAIAGGLAGALYGYDAIPEEWRKTLIKRKYIEDMCQKACDSWCVQ